MEPPSFSPSRIAPDWRASSTSQMEDKAIHGIGIVGIDVARNVVELRGLGGREEQIRTGVSSLVDRAREQQSEIPALRFTTTAMTDIVGRSPLSDNHSAAASSSSNSDPDPKSTGDCADSHANTA